MDNIIHIIISLGCFILLLILLTTILLKSSKRVTQNDRHKEANKPKCIHLSSLRSSYFPTELHYNSYFIKEYLLEIYELFMEISPKVIPTLTKIEKSINLLDIQIDNSDITFEQCNKEFTIMINALDEVTGELDKLSERFENLSEPSIDKNTEYQLSSEDIYKYINLVNTLMAITDNFGTTNLAVHRKLVIIYPELLPHYRQLSTKLIYTFYIELICVATQLDDGIIAYI